MAMRISRRAFMRLSALLPVAGLTPSPLSAGGPVYRRLGRTGLEVSEVGMGVMLTSDPDIVRAALDAGVNYFDTARSYMGGRNESILGKGLKGRRREAIIATKCHRYGSRESVISSAEKSLLDLGVDTIDIFQLHALSSKEEVLDEENIEALEELKASGKIRFAGVTTHSNMIEVMDAAVEAKTYDTVLTSFNFQSPPELAMTIGKTALAGLGVVAMKIMAGGYAVEKMPGFNPYQAALQWVLRRKAVSTAIPSMTSMEELEENIAVMGKTASLGNALSLDLYAEVTNSRYCRACGSCTGSCRFGADIPSAMRAVMYSEGYGRRDLAEETVAAIPLPCGECGGCSVECRFGLDVPSRMVSAMALKGSGSA